MKVTLGSIRSTVNSIWRAVTIQIYGNGDVRDAVRESSPAGVDSNPIAGMIGLYARTENNGVPVCVGYIDIQGVLSVQRVSQPGETRIFSTDVDGAMQINIYLTNSGDALIGSSADPGDYNDYAVSYNKLAQAFNQFKTDYDNHAHEVDALNAPSGPPVVPTTAEIEPSKIPNVKYIQP